MSPSAVSEQLPPQGYDASISGDGVHRKCFQKTSISQTGFKRTEFLFDRDLHKAFPVATGADENWIHLADGRKIFDATSGAAVACLGYNVQRVKDAMYRQLNAGIPYVASTYCLTEVTAELCQDLINGTGGKMGRAYLTGSGSEAMEAAIKMARQFYYEQDKETPRVNFIARESSYHGNTIGALGMSGHVARRAPYLPLLMDNNIYHVSSCNPYRQRKNDESDASFVFRKAAELEAKFQELGPETVIGFVAEPVVGAALGCVPSVPGYLKAMRDVCHRHGALFILDEVMSGMGRCGTLHAWQEEGIVPDLQTIGKGFGGGYQPISALMVSPQVVARFMEGSGQFIHGQTYQGMPIQAAAALEVQKALRDGNLIENVRVQGKYLEERLRSLLQDHPNVGDIRGRGLFWGLEFVKDKVTKEPFDPKFRVAQRVQEMAFSKPFNMTLYPGTGTADGVLGDHVILAPTYIVTREHIEHITQTTAKVINQVFEKMETWE